MRNLKKFSWGLVWLGIILLLVPSSVLGAEAGMGMSDEEAQAMLLLSSTTTSTTVGGGASLTLVLMDEEATGEMAAYLDDNAFALHHDLHLGDGEMIRDLAAAFAIPRQEQAAFGSLLFELRHRLMPLLTADKIDRAIARQFTEMLADELNTNPGFSVYIYWPAEEDSSPMARGDSIH